MSAETDLKTYLKMIDQLSGGRSFESLVLQYGQPYMAQALPKGYHKGKMRECYRNAYMLVSLHPELTYVEGFAHGAVIPVQHAWAVDKQGNVIDNTWRNLGEAYIGIPFPIRFVESILVETETWGIIKWESKIFRQAYPMKGGEVNVSQPSTASH